MFSFQITVINNQFKKKLKAIIQKKCEFCKQWQQMNDHNFNAHKFDFPGNVAQVVSVEVSDSYYSEILPHCLH